MAVESSRKRSAQLRRLLDFAGRHKRAAGLFFANFGVAKLAAFIGPLVLARLLEPSSYGAIEFGLSVAVFAAGVLSLGIPAALPQMTLLRRAMPMDDILAASVAVPGALCLCGAIAVAVLGGRDAAGYALALACTVLALAQGALSIYCRTHSLRSLAAWTDGFGTLTIVAVALIAFSVGLATVPVIAAGTAICAVGTILVAFAAAIAKKQPDLRTRLSSTLLFAAPVLVQSLVIVWFVVSGRIYIGTFLGAEAVALYGAAFRFASALLLVHAVLAIALFARLYAMRTRQYDQFLSLYFVFLAVLAVAMILIFPYVAARVPLRAIRSVDDVVRLFPIILLQTLAWGCIASLELRLARTRRAGRVAMGMLLLSIIIAAMVTLAGWHGVLTVRAVAWLSALQMILAVLIQFFVLWRRGLKMPRALSAFASGSMILILLTLTMTIGN